MGRLPSRVDERGRHSVDDPREETIDVYAVVKTGGKQHKVAEGDTLVVERLPGDVGETIELAEVILLGTEKGAVTEKASLKKATVHATIVEQGKDDKVIVFKFKRRKGYRRKRGHRQPVTKLAIDFIDDGSGKARPKAKAVVKTEAKAAEKKTVPKKATPKKAAPKKAEPKKTVAKKAETKAPKKPAVKKTEAAEKTEVSAKAAAKTAAKKTEAAGKTATKAPTKRAEPKKTAPKKVAPSKQAKGTAGKVAPKKAPGKKSGGK